MSVATMFVITRSVGAIVIATAIVTRAIGAAFARRGRR